MLRWLSYDIVFQEVPDEVALAVNISNCPNRCPGCHSPHLWEDVGERLDEDAVAGFLSRYGGAVTCICFMGGDAEPAEVERLSAFVRRCGRVKTAWYSGRAYIPSGFDLTVLDYVKLGSYVERLGGLDVAGSNQRFYRVENGALDDITFRFRKSDLVRNCADAVLDARM